MLNWSDLYSGMDTVKFHDSDELKAKLSIVFVMENHGHNVTHDGGKYVTTCPFHDDTNPSFDIYGEKLERWGCYADGLGGDVLDLVQRLYGIARFVEVKDKAAELLRLQEAQNWTGPRTGVRRSFDREEADKFVSASSGGGDGAWLALFDELAASRPALASIDPHDLRIAFRLGTQEEWTIAPIYDHDNDLVAYKRRKPGSKMLSARGASLTENFYGEWLDTDGSKPVLLVEGETDTWVGHSLIPEVATLGLLAGANTPTGAAHKLAGRHVILAFDGDEAGRRGLRLWYAALKDVAASVRIIVMPDGADLAKTEDVRALIDNLQAVPVQTPRIAQKPDGIYRIPRSEKSEAEQLSNFTLTPKRQLVGDGLSAWECLMAPSGREVVVSTHDLARDQSLVDWSARHGGSWFGSKVDAQHLQAHLQAEQPFLASGYTTSVAGLHSNHFIFPGGSIGPDHWVYTSGKTDIELHRYLEPLMRPEEDPHWHFSRELLQLRSLHDTSVMDPVLAWLALAPVRSLINPFPALAVLGGSGTGKTTLLETVLRRMTGSEIGVNLASTTRFAITAFTGATNSFPVWFDEYRPGAAADAIQALDQIVRDAYNGHGSVKGGMGDHWAQVKMLKSEAPMIVSGEDAFTETSHLERIIPVYLPVKGRNAQALFDIQQSSASSWAWRWMEILRHALINDEIDLRVRPVQASGLAPRMQYNLGVLHLGWSLLQEYAERINGIDIGDPDFSRIHTTLTTDAQSNPIKDALNWCLGEPFAADFMWVDHDVVYVRVENFVAYVKKSGTYTLPGNHKAVRRFLHEQLHGEDVRTRMKMTDQQVRAVKIPVVALGQDK